jgi:hypothetical protein
MTVVNMTKEATYQYSITAEVLDPAAEEKIAIECRAREEHIHILKVRPFVQNGQINVTSTVPLLTFPPKIAVKGCLVSFLH